MKHLELPDVSFLSKGLLVGSKKTSIGFAVLNISDCAVIDMQD